MQVIAAGGWI